MVLECELGYFTPIEIFYLLSRFKKSGRLEFETGEVYFIEGNVVHAKRGELTGMEALYQLSLEESGKIRFFPDEKPEEITISEETGTLFEEIERRKLEIKEFKEKLPPFDTVPLKSTRTPEGEKIALRKKDWKVLILVDGKRTIKEIIEQSGLGALDAYQTLHWLFEKGLIYDPEAKKRLIEEGKKKLGAVLSSLGEGPWKDEVLKLINEMELSGVVEVNGGVKVDAQAGVSPEKLGEFFESAFERIKSKAEEVLGKVLAKKKIQDGLKKAGVK
ncbi:hypothetical protein DRQ18_01065 [bacterium]|nr:MAG: hypothetical protein DRQ18_01065 [bacterium]